MELGSELKSKIEGLIASDDVVLFMKGNKNFPQCGFSATVVQILNQVAPRFSTVNVLADPEIRQGIKIFSDWPTIPQLYVNGEFVGGCDIVKAMYESGDLHKQLGLEVTTPTITITDNAKTALQAALGDASPGSVVFFSIKNDFTPELGVGEADPSCVTMTANGLTLQIDRGSLPRAEGVTIDYATAPRPGFKITNPNEPPRVKEIGPAELKAKLDAGEVAEFFDVRTEDERKIATIEGAKMFTDAEMERVEELDPNTIIAFHCHHGGRSYNAAAHFVSLGFRNVYNLKGGIDAWALEVDSNVPRY